MRRVFSLALGLGAGIVIGAWVIRRVDRAQRAVAPTNLASRAGHTAGSITQRFQDAVEEGRRAANEREAQLRRRYLVPSLQDSLGPPTEPDLAP